MLNESDRSKLEAAVMLSRVISAPGVEGPNGQDPAVDALATFILSVQLSEMVKKAGVDEVRRLVALYFRHESELLK